MCQEKMDLSVVWVMILHTRTSYTHLSFLEVKNVFKKSGFKPDGGQFVKSQKKGVSRDKLKQCESPLWTLK